MSERRVSVGIDIPPAAGRTFARGVKFTMPLLQMQTAAAAGAASAEITPPLEVGLLMSSVEGLWSAFEGVQSPLMARALVLRPARRGSENGVATEPVAVVALDLLGLNGQAVDGWPQFKARIAAAAGNVLRPERIVLACSHTHCAPESVALSNLYETSAFESWVALLVSRIGQAIREAAGTLRPCRLAYGSTAALGRGIHRRIQTSRGVLLSHPPPPEEIVLSRGGPVDDSVNVLVARDLHDEASVIATVVNATCHPVHEMCIPRVSADYPGVVSETLEAAHPGSVALFLNGAAGNINPTTVSAGADASRRHGLALAAAAQGLLTADDGLTDCEGVAFERRAVTLPTRLPNGRPEGRVLCAEVAALRVGPASFVFLPGEPFVETGLKLRARSPFALTAVVGYAEDYIGYVPTDAALAEGGYEAAFGKWSVLGIGSEPKLCGEASALLDALHGGLRPAALVGSATEEEAASAAAASAAAVNGRGEAGELAVHVDTDRQGKMM
jgi:hypothetical protein